MRINTPGQETNGHAHDTGGAAKGGDAATLLILQELEVPEDALATHEFGQHLVPALEKRRGGCSRLIVEVKSKCAGEVKENSTKRVNGTHPLVLVAVREEDVVVDHVVIILSTKVSMSANA
jgi:hypothetical protein